MGLSTQQGVHVWVHKSGLRWRTRIDGSEIDLAIEEGQVRAYAVTGVTVDSMRPYTRCALAALPPAVLEMLMRCMRRAAPQRR
jgi:hypothetical protein